jgi:arabinose-5-phosphate isomerase
VELIPTRSGRVVVSGIGKSGHIARKSPTLASTGTPAFVHRRSQSRDLGMITAQDVMIGTNSGESAELLAIAP